MSDPKTQITILPVTVAEVFDAPNAVDLLQAYATACSVPNAVPQRDTYAALEQVKTLKCFGAYAAAQLIGFCSVLTARMPHTGQLQVVGESLFVAPAYRGTGAGNKLIDAAEKYADSIPARLAWLPRTGSQLDKVLARRVGYALTHSQYTRRLA